LRYRHTRASFSFNERKFMVEEKEKRLNLEEEDTVQYTDKSMALVVEIAEILENDDFVRYEAKVLDEILGSIEEDTFMFGCTKDKSLHHYVTWKVKEPWEMPQYIDAGEIDEIQEKLSEIEDKYKDSAQ